MFFYGVSAILLAVFLCLFALFLCPLLPVLNSMVEIVTNDAWMLHPIYVPYKPLGVHYALFPPQCPRLEPHLHADMKDGLVHVIGMNG